MAINCYTIILLTLLGLPTNARSILDLIGKAIDSEDIHLDSPQDYEIFNETMLTVPEFANAYGYPAENHTVYTEDGYILTIFRIPFGKDDNGNEGNETVKRKPVLVMHGITSSSSLIIDSGKPSLGFYLADNNYDVWLGNMRGTFYSSHQNYTRHQHQFWDFSWQEIGEHDIPPMVDYILNETQSEQIIYIGHSMGCTVGLVFMSTHVEYNKKISGFVALSPVHSLAYAPTPLRLTNQYKDQLENIADLLTLHGLSLSPYFFKVEELFCPYSNPALCSVGINTPGGYSYNIRNSSRDYLYINHASCGASIRSLLHFGQTIDKKGMYKYDYGLFRNLISKYHQLTPPEFPLSKITVPVVIFYSANDALADPIDVILLSKKLKNVIGLELVGPALMSHIDMLYAIDAKNIFQDKMLRYLKKFE